MIRADFRTGGGEYALTVEGHATGSPEVCAGVSAIVYALYGALSNTPEHTQGVSAELESGDARLRWAGDAVAEAFFEMAAVGLLQIEKSHPEKIAVSQAKTDS